MEIVDIALVLSQIFIGVAFMYLGWQIMKKPKTFISKLRQEKP